MILLFKYQEWAGLGLLLLTITVDILTDYRRWLSKKPINHTRSNIIAAVPVIISFILMGWWSIGLIFTYWAVKDAALGTLMTRSPLYVGTTAKLDTLQRANPWLMVAKFVLGIGGLVIFIIKS
jgi:hypothetical protein